MQVSVSLFLMALALVCLLLAAVLPEWCAPPRRFHLGWVGMFFWLLSLLWR